MKPREEKEEKSIGNALGATVESEEHQYQRELLIVALTQLGHNLTEITHTTKDAKTQLTVQLLQKIVNSATLFLQTHLSILPGLTPLFMALHGMLGLPDYTMEIQQSLATIFLDESIIYSNYLLVLDSLNTNSDSQADSGYSLPALIRTLEIVIMDDKEFIKNFIMDDIVSLEKQLGSQIVNDRHEYRDSSAPYSKALLLTETNYKEKTPVNKAKFASVIPWREAQKGQTCKIHAFHSSAWVTHLLDEKNTPCPLPIHPHANYKENKPTLVAQAQKLFLSKIGEVHSPAYLLKLARSNHFNNLTLYQCTEKNYLEQLKKIVDQGMLALIYFDVRMDNADPDTVGFPCEEKSTFEHSAVVCGYKTYADVKMTFIIYQWSQYYEFDAVDLLKSTGQLALKRKPETFYNIGTKDNEYWIDDVRIKASGPKVHYNYVEQRTSHPVPDELPGFRHCIISVGKNKDHTISLPHEELIAAIQTNDFDKFSNLVSEHSEEEIADIPDENGYTALSWTVITNNLEMLQFLLDAGANIDIIDKQGRNLNEIAIFYDSRDVLKYLQEQADENDEAVEIISSLGNKLGRF